MLGKTGREGREGEGERKRGMIWESVFLLLLFLLTFLKVCPDPG
jgi:hypothetical protein